MDVSGELTEHPSPPERGRERETVGKRARMGGSFFGLGPFRVDVENGASLDGEGGAGR